MHLRRELRWGPRGYCCRLWMGTPCPLRTLVHAVWSHGLERLVRPEVYLRVVYALSCLNFRWMLACSPILMALVASWSSSL